MVEPSDKQSNTKSLDSGSTGASSTTDVYVEGLESPFTIKDAREMTKPTSQLLCRLSDNKYIRFGEYVVRDHDSKTLLIGVSEEMNRYQDEYARNLEATGRLSMDDRILKQRFSPEFFLLKNIELNLTFHVVDPVTPLKDLVLIEKHFFRGEIINSYEF